MAGGLTRPWTVPEDIFDLIEPVHGRLAGRQRGCATRCLTCGSWRANVQRRQYARLRDAFQGWVLGIARIGDLIIECETGTELPEHAREACRG